MPEKPYLSIVLPVYNEAGNIRSLLPELHGITKQLEHGVEVIAVDDGSQDESLLVLKEWAMTHDYLSIISFQRNFGQTAAIIAGIQQARGEVVVLMDSDLENDPADIARLLGKLHEGYDVVSGWRKDRWQGQWLSRRLPSVMANWLISFISGVTLHDYGCTLKAYRSDVIKGALLYGEMHRFIPVYAHWQGGRVAELQVNHRARQYGASNYGIVRIFRVVLDLILIKFLERYMNRPLHFFGGLGFGALFLGLLSGVAAVILRFWGIATFIETPLPILVTLFFIVGVQLVALGIVAEVLMRTYYESQQKTPYRIKEKINCTS